MQVSCTPNTLIGDLYNWEKVIAYVENSSGGAYKAMAYAEKTEKPVSNLATDCEE